MLTCRYHLVNLGTTPNLCFDAADSEDTLIVLLLYIQAHGSLDLLGA